MRKPRVGVITFPGSLDDRDALRAVRFMGGEGIPLWHAERDLHDVDAAPGDRLDLAGEHLAQQVKGGIEQGGDGPRQGEGGCGADRGTEGYQAEAGWA